MKKILKKIRIKFCLAQIIFLIVGCAENKLLIADASLPSKHEIFDPNHYLGDHIKISKPQPGLIKQVILDITSPEGYQFIANAKPQMRLLSKNGLLLKSFDIPQLDHSRFNVNLTVPDDLLFAELSLYYCRESKRGLCLIKKILFEIPVNHGLLPNDVFLTYTITDEAI